MLAQVIVGCKRSVGIGIARFHLAERDHDNPSSPYPLMKNWHRISRISGALIVISLLQLVSPSDATAMDGEPASPNNCVAQWEVATDLSESCGCSVGWALFATNSPDCQEPCSYVGTVTKICPGPVVTTVAVPFEIACTEDGSLDLTCPTASSPYLRARFYCAPCL